MSDIPYCFPSQRIIGSYLLALWTLNFSIIELTIVKQHRFLPALTMGWNETAWSELFPPEGDRGCRGCDTMGMTQDSAGRDGGEWGHKGSYQPPLSPSQLACPETPQKNSEVGGEAHDSAKQVQIKWKWTGKVPVLSLVTGQTWLMLTLMHFLRRLLGAAGGADLCPGAKS